MSRRDRKKAETRENIIECAVGLFREKGFQETPMEEIAEKADISKGTLYNYFPDKESILSGYFQTIIAGHGDQIQEILKEHLDIETRLNRLMNLMGEVYKKDNELTVAYLTYRIKEHFSSDPMDDTNRSGMGKYLLEIVRKAQEEGQLRKDVPLMILTRNFQFLVRSFLISSLKSKENIQIDNIREQLIGLFLYGAKL